ncbi:hypothetical protein JCM6882_001472 [Rhodosporidiobolus microsporus]
MAQSSFPDYYAVLGVPSDATPDQIKTAYKRRSLQTHPDRIPATPGNDERRKAATVEFQAVADAHYTLSDPARRRAYDNLRQANQSRWSDRAEESGNFWSYFGGGKEAPAEDPADEEFESERPDADHVFGDVFEEMLRPEVQRVLPLWTWTGAAAGAALGFIVANLAGAAVGAFGGSKLGAVRDAKGKSVMSVFQQLGGDQKAEILKGLAAKVFSMAAK